MYKFRTSRHFDKQYAKLPQRIQEKVDKQLNFLAQNIYHHSLNTKKMQAKSDLWECRVDYQYRIVFELHDEVIILLFVGTHDIYKQVE